MSVENGTILSASSVCSSIDLSNTSSSTTNSIPSISSVDSALIWLYTSCEFKNFPYKAISKYTAASSVLSICTLPNNLFLVRTLNDGVLIFQEYKRGELSLVGSLSTPGGSVKSIVYENEQVYTCHQDGVIRVWRFQQVEMKLRMSNTLPTKYHILTRCILPSNYVKTRRHHRTLWIQHADAVSSVSCTKDLVFSVSWDRTLKVWRLSDNVCLESVSSAHEDAINAVVAAGHFVYTAGADGKIKGWEYTAASSSSRFTKPKRSRLTLIGMFDKHKSSVNALIYDELSGYLYSASSDKTVRAWEREETAMHLAPVDVLKGHCMSVLCLSALRSHTSSSHVFVFCSGSADKTVRVWSRDRQTGVHSCLSVIKGHLSPVKSVCITATNSRFSEALVVSGNLKGELRTTWLSLDGSDQEESVNK